MKFFQLSSCLNHFFFPFFFESLALLAAACNVHKIGRITAQQIVKTEQYILTQAGENTSALKSSGAGAAANTQTGVAVYIMLIGHLKCQGCAHLFFDRLECSCFSLSPCLLLDQVGLSYLLSPSVHTFTSCLQFSLRSHKPIATIKDH